MHCQPTEHLFQSGYYGKVPGRGDFVHHYLPREFIDSWDAWLQRAISQSRNSLLDQWLDTYLTSPIWRYYLSPGLCGKHAWVGVVMPSVDKVGRYYPLTMACPMPAALNPFQLMKNQTQWFENAEKLMLALLDENGPSVEDFDLKVEQLSRDFSTKKNTGFRGNRQPIFGTGPLWHLPLTDIDDASRCCDELSWQMLRARFSTCSLWWSDGSEQVMPSFLVSAGLPEANSFVAMMDGKWADGNWEEWPAEPDVNASHGGGAKLSIDQLLLLNPQEEKTSSLTWTSNAISDVGKVRSLNEDACLNLPASGLWVVADGMGGHTAGEIASGMVVEKMGHLGVFESLNEFVDAVIHCLKSVNQKLRLMAREKDVSTIGCTVVVLVIVNQRAAFLWAGDSRVYLSRNGELEQLTQDHGYEMASHPDSEPLSDNAASNVVTRAIGADSELDLEVGTIDLKAGDRFLLCTDGLNKEISNQEIAEFMSAVGAQYVAQELMDLSLERGARDNVTVLTVELFSAK